MRQLVGQWARGGWSASECGSLGFGSMREEEQCQNDTVQILLFFIIYFFYLWGPKIGYYNHLLRIS
jgi:hypothetical protein